MNTEAFEVKVSLEEARLLRKKRQKDMAMCLHINISTYRKLEKNPEQITISQFKKIMKFLDLPPYAFNFF